MSVIVISYNMTRELPRTLYSLSAGYQRDITREEYEVILVDNGSKIPPTDEDFLDLDIDLTVYHYENPTHSPVAAINMGLNRASGQFIGVCIDGARIHSPRVLATAREGLSLADRSIVAVRGRYLGSKMQRESIADGYDQATEDKLLESSGWRTDGYRLFDFSVFDESSGPTWASPIAESNALFMGRSMWREINGFDPRFNAVGGGLVNLDTWKRVVELPNVSPIILAGEATFHQVHGGVATNGRHDIIHSFFDQYEHIHGYEFKTPQVEFSLLGQFQHGALFAEGLVKNTAVTGKRKKSGKLRVIASDLLSQKLSATSRRKLRVVYDLLESIVSRNPLEGIRNLKQEKRQAEILEAHPLFDSEWYEMMYPHVVAAGYKPSWHFIRFGASQRTSPGPIFDAGWYLDYYADVEEGGENPLVHYLMFGEGEGRRVRLGAQALGQYVRANENELREIIVNSSLFDADWYVSQYPDVPSSNLDPAIHYLRLGTLLRRNPSKNFDGIQYRRDHLDVLKSGINPLVHFESLGRAEGRNYQAVLE